MSGCYPRFIPPNITTVMKRASNIGMLLFKDYRQSGNEGFSLRFDNDRSKDLIAGSIEDMELYLERMEKLKAFL